jgi:hypothetical protein
MEDMGREQMRAADADRQQVAEHLRVALAEGRLDLAEYDERLQGAYAAKTYADLDRLLADLPNAAPVVPAAPAPPPAAPVAADNRVTSAWLGHVWGPWARTLAVLTVIWLIGSLISGEPVAYWPVWILAPWAVVLLMRTGGGLAKGEPREHAAAEEHRRRLRAHRRERRALQRRAIARGELPANPTKAQRKAFIAEAVARGDLPPKPRRASG